jgi:leader peptidase (prepilin peptidase)/N-methyltransferase
LYRSHPLIPIIPIYAALSAAVFGLAFGSFLNVCISRLPRHESIVRPRSHCPRCGAMIRSGDNIPILSWILLRGRCRHCRQPIAWRYPAVELATAALFLLSELRFGLTVTGIGMAILSFLLLGLAVMDAETMRLPDAFTLPGIALGILYSTLLPADHLGHAIASILWAASAALLLLLLRRLYFVIRHQEGLGLGEVDLLAMIAAWLGPWEPSPPVSSASSPSPSPAADAPSPPPGCPWVHSSAPPPSTPSSPASPSSAGTCTSTATDG